MNTVEFTNPVIMPFFIIAAGVVMIVLLTLTLRSIVLREKAMIRRNREDAAVRASYETRWRTPGAA